MNDELKQKQFYTFNQSGQAAILIVLIMIVVLTIAISTVSRTLTDIKISVQTDDGAKAQEASEAGIEKELLELQQVWNNGSNIPTSCIESIHCNVPLDSGSTTMEYYFEKIPKDPAVDADVGYYLGSIPVGESKTIWLTTKVSDPLQAGGGSGNYYQGPNTGNAVQINWEHLNPSSPVEIILYAKDSNAPNDPVKVKRWIVPATDNATALTKDQLTNLGTTSRPLFLRVKPLGNEILNVRVSRYTSDFKPQGFKVVSIGKYNPSNTWRKTEVSLLFPHYPSAFEYVMMGDDIDYSNH